jgi:hypothetical protein
MIVMTATTQSKSAMSRTVAPILQAQPGQVWETPEDVSRVAEQIRAGEAFLQVVAYPWGVEFEVFNQEGKV